MTPLYLTVLTKKIYKYQHSTRNEEGEIPKYALDLIKMLYNYILNIPVSGIDDLPDIFDPITKL
jgi:hypothetical protein